MSNQLASTSLGQPRQILAPDTAPLALLLITLLALLLRLFRLGANSLWVDELITLWQGTVLGDSLWRQFLDDPQAPLPMVIVSAVSQASSAEAWLRLPGAVLGAASPVLLYFAGRRWVGERAALFAAFLLAVHPFHILHSQEVRGYAYMLFFGLAAIALASHSRGRLGVGRMVAIATLGTAACLSNQQALPWMGGLALALLLAGQLQRENLLRWTLCFLLMLVSTAPWWTASLGIHESDRLLPGSETGEPLRGDSTWSAWSLPYSGFVLSIGPTLGPSDAELHENITAGSMRLPTKHVPLTVVVAVLTLVLFAAGLRKLGRRSWPLLALAAIPVAIAVFLAMRNVKPFNPRYVLAALPTLLLIVGAGFHSLAPRSAVVILAAWLGLSAFALQRHYFDPQYMREDVRSAARLVASREGSDDVVLVPTVYRVFDHYYRGNSPVHNMFGVPGSDPERLTVTLADLDPQRRYLWYVRSRPWFNDPNGRLLASLEEKYATDARFTLPGVEVYLFDRESHADGSGSD